MKNQRRSTSRRVGYVTAPDHVTNELPELSDITFRNKSLMFKKQRSYQNHPSSYPEKHAHQQQSVSA